MSQSFWKSLNPLTMPLALEKRLRGHPVQGSWGKEDVREVSRAPILEAVQWLAATVFGWTLTRQLHTLLF